jgi:AraC family transcriptional regulator
MWPASVSIASLTWKSVWICGHYDVSVPENTVLMTTDQLALGLSRCGVVPTDRTDEEIEEQYTLVFPLSGAFGIDLEGTSAVATPAKAILFSSGQSREVRHPFGGHDESAFISMTSGMAEPFLTPSGRFRVVASATNCRLDYEMRRLIAAAKFGQVESMEFEEFTVGALGELTDANPEQTGSVRSEAVRRADEYLATHFREDCGLSQMARHVGYSSHHLSRSFKEVTGETVSRRRMRLRLSDALSRILDGANDLTTVAVESGFYDHSHMTNSFRRYFGDSPNGVRLNARERGTGSFAR